LHSAALARALAAGLPRRDHVYSTTDESFRFHNKKIDEMRCKLDSTDNPRSFVRETPNPTLITPVARQFLQPVPWKLRLGMVIATQNEILIGIKKLPYYGSFQNFKQKET